MKILLYFVFVWLALFGLRRLCRRLVAYLIPVQLKTDPRDFLKTGSALRGGVVGWVQRLPVLREYWKNRARLLVEGAVFRVQSLPAGAKAGLALGFSGMGLFMGFVVVMQWVEPRFPSIVRGTLYFFSTILAVIILKYFYFFSETIPGEVLLAFLLLVETLFFRPFVFSHAVFFPLLLVSMAMVIVVWSWLRPGSVLKKGIRMLVAFYGVVPFLILLSMLMAYRGTHGCEQVQQNPNVKFLLDFCASGWREEIFRRTGYATDVLNLNAEARSIFVSSDGRVIFAGTGLQDDKNERLLLAIDRNSRKILKAFSMSTPFRGVCMGGKCAVSVPVEHRVYILDEKQMRFTKKIKLSYGPLFMSYDFASKKVFMPWMIGDDVSVLNLKKVELMEHVFASIRKYVYPHGVSAAVEYSPLTRNLYMVTEMKYFSRPCLYLYAFDDSGSAPRLSKVCFSYWDTLMSLGPAIGLAVNVKRKEIYMGLPYEGSIYVIQEGSFNRLRKIHVGVGLRELTFDSRRGVLYAANYIRGEIVGVSPETGRILKKIFVGRRIRQISYEPRIDRLLATSANGFMEIRLDN